MPPAVSMHDGAPDLGPRYSCTAQWGRSQRKPTGQREDSVEINSFKYWRLLRFFG